MIGDKLKQLRNSNGLSQRELAQKLGVSGSTVAMIESGKREGSREVLSKIAIFFDVSLDYLYGLEDSQPVIKTQTQGSKQSSKQSLIENFLDELISEGIVTSLDDIDTETEQAILNAVKAQIELKLKKKNK